MRTSGCTLISRARPRVPQLAVTVSNAGINEPNPGKNFLQFRYTHHFNR